MGELLIATTNQGKKREFETLFHRVFDSGWTLTDLGQLDPRPAEVVEDAETFHGNAIKKAVEYAEVVGISTLSEDSGLSVDALDGAPGVYSARFSGEGATDARNNALLVERLAGVPDAQRTARYVSVLCLALGSDEAGERLRARLGLPAHEALPEGAPEQPGVAGRVGQWAVIWFLGTVEGTIRDEARGEHGFGYDPHFLLAGEARHMAELTAQEKGLISHRGNALRAFEAAMRG